MKITFLGTGAADWTRQEHSTWPGYRRNSSALIDDVLLIDPGPDVPLALEAFHKDKNAIRCIINTHRHPDHYSEETLRQLPGAEFVEIKAGQQIQKGSYCIRGLQANHGTCDEAVHFIISDGEKNLFYGLDGAWLLYEEYLAIQETGIDLAVLDATVGFADGDFRIFQHNDLNMVLELKKALAPWIRRCCISHMARTLHTDHATLASVMAAQGVETAFDGLELTL